jgi:hypothetical protein
MCLQHPRVKQTLRIERMELFDSKTPLADLLSNCLPGAKRRYMLKMARIQGDVRGEKLTERSAVLKRF